MIEQNVDSFEKRLSPRFAQTPEAIARLVSEGILLEKLGGRVTPRLRAQGEDERGPWIRLERLRFPTLAERIERGAVDKAWVSRAATSVFAAFAELHGATDELGPLGVIHADPSPANIAIDDAGARVVLLDFDLAWWRESRPPNDGAFRGTIGYVAPEVARGELPSVQSDLFSAAASLLHAWTGERPRPGDSFPALLAAAAEAPLVLPADLPETIARWLAFAPEARPPCANQASCPPVAPR